jgi:hypothetical protein
MREKEREREREREREAKHYSKLPAKIALNATAEKTRVAPRRPPERSRRTANGDGDVFDTIYTSGIERQTSTTTWNVNTSSTTTPSTT